LLSAAPAYAQDGAKGVDEAWIGAVKAGNVDAVVALYAPDAVLYPPDALEARGTAAIRASYTEMLGAMTINEATIDSQYQTSGDFSVGFGKATLTMTPKGGGSPQIVSVRVHGRGAEDRRKVALRGRPRVGANASDSSAEALRLCRT
jgi:ketosteroid isomerase-like protein